MIRILLIGPLPPPMGGDTRHFVTLSKDLIASERYSVTVINTSRGREHSRFFRNIAAAVSILFQTALRLRRSDVISYHASDRGMLLFAPLIVGLGKVAGKPTVLRVFGGSFGDFYESQNQLTKMLIRRLILSADVVLLQTRRLVRQLEKQARARLVWFSTYIEPACAAPDVGDHNGHGHERSCSRFVFLGHLWRAKGLETILEAAPNLLGECSIDIYGPPDEYTAAEITKRGCGRVRYCGFLTHQEVDLKLWDYDCVVLPTHHPGEGYPGVIAEAFAHELPVITTRWLAIPEIVDDDCGILIEPRDTPAFIAAMTALYLDRDRWLTLKRGALLRARQFDHAIWSVKFEEVCEQLVSR
jgi:glycosyltransferase involved in cell wall biosynthesis